MRSFWVVVHRWFGLFIAVFLLVAGLTGAVISWDHELDEWLNPRLFETGSRGAYLQPLDLVARVEAADPRRRVTFFPLQYEQGHGAAFSVTGRVDPATRQQFEIGHNQVFVDAVTGKLLGQRDWGKVALDREHLLPFLYKLHYSLHIPEMASIDRWGVWFMGVVGLVWLFDGFVGFYLTLPRRRAPSPRATPAPLHPPSARGEGHGGAVPPARGEGQPQAPTLAYTSAPHPNPLPTEEWGEGTDALRGEGARTWRQRWKPAWQVKWRASSYRVHLDLHRAAGLWFWLLLLVIAFTSLSMNLQFEVVRPLLQTLSTLTPNPFETRAPRSRHEPIEPKLGFAEAIARAGGEAASRGWAEPVGNALYAPDYGIYAVGFYAVGSDPHGSGGLGVKTIYLDGGDGRILGEQVPWRGTAADVFMQLQFPMHSGRIAGIPGRILISIMGLVVALLSFTGIVIWLKKRAGRINAELKRLSPAARAH